MDKFFWLEVAVPIFLTAVMYSVFKSLLSKFQKSGYKWGILFSIVALFFIVFVWIYASRYFNSIQCEVAYGDLASDPKMCDNPANGISAFFQIPILMIAWISVSVFAFFKLNMLKKKFSAI